MDFFERPDGTFGYEEYRRDEETAEGWFPIGFYSGIVFDTLDLAKSNAKRTIGWLGQDI